MKITIVALAAVIVTGCAAPPSRPVAMRQPVTLTQRAFDEIAAARA